MYIDTMEALKKKPIQIYIEPRQDDILEVLSKRRGVSKAAIIRESIDNFLKELPVEKDPAMGIIGLGKSGKGNLSSKHDRYLAGYLALKKS
jgi:hypothetical protein